MIRHKIKEIQINKILPLEKKLKKTDYVITKITEAEKFYPEEVSSLIEKYAPIVEERKVIRTQIDGYMTQVTELRNQLPKPR
jgi:hypothetical protein